MKKIILYVLGAVIVVAFAVSRFIDWPIDSDNASGDIAKSSRFSRQLADAGVSNMQELVLNDEEFKNNLVTVYLVMKTRADQFNALVDMSTEVCGGIPEFESVIKEMKEVQPLINNVCASVETAGNDLNVVLGGESANDLEQNTSNASVAYSTLQKENRLADKFIEVADNYLKKEVGNDRIKFVRDQWVDYQKVTAAIDQNEQQAKELANKGYKLSENKRAAALSSFSGPEQLASIYGSSLGVACGLEGLSLSNTINTLDIALSANQRRKVVEASEQQAELSAVEQSALSAVEQGALSEVFSVCVSAIEQGGALSAVQQGGALNAAQQGGALGAVQQRGALSAVQQGGALSAAQQGGALSAVQQGGVLNMIGAVVGMPNVLGAVEGLKLGNTEIGGAMLGMSRPIPEFLDAIGRPSPFN